MENENEDTLKTVEDCEEVSHDNPLIIDIEDTNDPGRSKKNNQDNRSLDPGPETHTTDAN